MGEEVAFKVLCILESFSAGCAPVGAPLVRVFISPVLRKFSQSACLEVTKVAGVLALLVLAPPFSLEGGATIGHVIRDKNPGCFDC